ncbi:MAG: L-seryl-tRNA(Sec) selenium transferase, partial [Calditrichia bacterium]|nr:L-seryl-tRNA(Sec) selenium transferase [Calditrichia bacterium]
VNNNAAAVLLLLNTFGKDKNVILSRGELVEIGGSFRMPEVMEISGAKLKEIGATNRTHLKDYKNAIDGETSMILKVHPSNFRISGFSKEVEVQDLKNITEINNILLCYDLGGGALFDLSEVNLPKEPVVAELINQKIDLITFSGDKLIGGPQCGIIVGKKELIEKMHKNPMYRALRVDKNTIALLEATLRTFINKDITGNELYRKNNRSLKELKTIGNSLLKGLKTTSGGKEYFKIVESPVQIGSGALPVEDIPSIAIRFDIPNLSVEKIAKHFRELSIPVVGYIQDNSYFWNLKTLRKKDCSYLRDSLINLVGTIREKK